MRNQKSSLKNQPKQLNKYLKYSGLAFQFMAATVLGFWLGTWLDTINKNEKPWFTLVFMGLFIAATLVKVIRDISHE